MKFSNLRMAVVATMAAVVLAPVSTVSAHAGQVTEQADDQTSTTPIVRLSLGDGLHVNNTITSMGLAVQYLDRETYPVVMFEIVPTSTEQAECWWWNEPEGPHYLDEVYGIESLSSQRINVFCDNRTDAEASAGQFGVVLYVPSTDPNDPDGREELAGPFYYDVPPITVTAPEPFEIRPAFIGKVTDQGANIWFKTTRHVDLDGFEWTVSPAQANCAVLNVHQHMGGDYVMYTRCEEGGYSGPVTFTVNATSADMSTERDGQRVTYQTPETAVASFETTIEPWPTPNTPDTPGTPEVPVGGGTDTPVVTVPTPPLPAPIPAPSVASVEKGKKRVSVTLAAPAGQKVQAQRKEGKKWVKVATTTASPSTEPFTWSKKMPRGVYRFVITGPTGEKTTTSKIRIR